MHQATLTRTDGYGESRDIGRKCQGEREWGKEGGRGERGRERKGERERERERGRERIAVNLAGVDPQRAGL